MEKTSENITKFNQLNRELKVVIDQLEEAVKTAEAGITMPDSDDYKITKQTRKFLIGSSV